MMTESHPWGSFDEIVARYGGMVFGVCRRSLGNAPEAEDAAQTVFLTFLEKAPSLGRDTVVGTWLYRTAVYVSCNLIRSRVRRAQAPPAPAPEPAPERAWEEAKPHLDDAISRLPERLQDALVVHYLQGKTLAETAAALDCPVKTIEKRVGRGLQKLRELLTGAGVAITSAALVALLQQEARAATPSRMAEALRGMRLPAVAAGMPLLRKLLIPAAAALVVAGFVAGTLRLAARDRSGSGSATTRAGAAADAARSNPPGTAPASAASTGRAAGATSRAFPATFDEFRVLFKRLMECPEDAARWEALGIGVSRDDLASVLKRNDYDPQYVDPMIVDLFQEWAGREPRSAAEWLYRAFALIPTTGDWKIRRPSDSGPGNLTMLEAVLNTWYRREPAAVESWVKKLPPGAARNAVVVELALVAGRQDPGRCEDLAAMVDELPPSWSRRVAAIRVAEEWAKRDPKSAAAWILKLPPRGPEEPSHEPVFTLADPDGDPGLPPLATLNEDTVNASDVPVLVERLDKVDDLVAARMGALLRITRSWAASDLPAARLWSEGLADPFERAKTMAVVGEIWAESDPRAMLDYARAHPDAEWRDDWLGIAADGLIAADRAAAESLVALVSPDQRDRIWAHALERLEKERPAESARATLEAMVRCTDRVGQSQYSNNLWNSMRNWVKQDPKGAVSCAEAIGESELKVQVLNVVGQCWADTDPRAALEWACRLPGELQGYLVGIAARDLAATDLELARRTAVQLTEPVGREQALQGVATAWGRTAPETALAWARSMPAEDRDSCIAGVLTAWAERDPDAALAQVGCIADEQHRPRVERAIQQIRMGAERAKLREGLLRRKEGE